MTARVVDLPERLSLFSEHWSPKVVAGRGGYAVRVVRLKGEFFWHSHPETDGLFLVVEGTLVIQLRDGDVTLGPGQLYVVPKGSSTGRSPTRRQRGAPRLRRGPARAGGHGQHRRRGRPTHGRAGRPDRVVRLTKSCRWRPPGPLRGVAARRPR